MKREPWYMFLYRIEKLSKKLMMSKIILGLVR